MLIFLQQKMSFEQKWHKGHLTFCNKMLVHGMRLTLKMSKPVKNHPAKKNSTSSELLSIPNRSKSYFRTVLSFSWIDFISSYRIYRCHLGAHTLNPITLTCSGWRGGRLMYSHPHLYHCCPSHLQPKLPVSPLCLVLLQCSNHPSLSFLWGGCELFKSWPQLPPPHPTPPWSHSCM